MPFQHFTQTPHPLPASLSSVPFQHQMFRNTDVHFRHMLRVQTACCRADSIQGIRDIFTRGVMGTLQVLKLTVFEVDHANPGKLVCIMGGARSGSGEPGNSNNDYTSARGGCDTRLGMVGYAFRRAEIFEVEHLTSQPHFSEEVDGDIVCDHFSTDGSKLRHCFVPIQENSNGGVQGLVHFATTSKENFHGDLPGSTSQDFAEVEAVAERDGLSKEVEGTADELTGGVAATSITRRHNPDVLGILEFVTSLGTIVLRKSRQYRQHQHADLCVQELGDQVVRLQKDVAQKGKAHSQLVQILDSIVVALLGLFESASTNAKSLQDDDVCKRLRHGFLDDVRRIASEVVGLSMERLVFSFSDEMSHINDESFSHHRHHRHVEAEATSSAVANGTIDHSIQILQFPIALVKNSTATGCLKVMPPVMHLSDDSRANTEVLSTSDEELLNLLCDMSGLVLGFETLWKTIGSATVSKVQHKSLEEQARREKEDTGTSSPSQK